MEVPSGKQAVNDQEIRKDAEENSKSLVLNIFSRGYHLLYCICVPALSSLSLKLNKLGVDRDSIGSSCVVGDHRWAGTYGVQADFIAKSHCSVEFVTKEAINVRLKTHSIILQTIANNTLQDFGIPKFV